MIRISHRYLFLKSATLWLLLAAVLSGQVVSRLSSRYLARGEKALFEIAIPGARNPQVPVIPKIQGVDIQMLGSGNGRGFLGRKVEYVFRYMVSSYEMGSHTLPSIEVTADGAISLTEPLDFTVFDPGDLEWSEAQLSGKTVRYASTFKVLNDRPFVGETTPVEIKLYVPQDQAVEDWGIPQFERDGLTAWRNPPSLMRGEVYLLGKPFFSVAYPTTLTPTRSGTVTIGPATVRLVTSQVIMDGYMRRVAEEVNLKVPALKLNARALPTDAPPGFENAVGNFRMEVNTSSTEVIEGDPIPLEIVVRGSGNLDTLRPPKPLDTQGWKIYEPTSDLRGDERRDLAGTTVFRQFLRPLEFKAEIPRFRLVFFDPKTLSYETALTEPIPLQMKPAIVAVGQGAAPPRALPVPVERMNDILGLAVSGALTMKAPAVYRPWLLHLLGGGIASLLLLRIIWIRNAHRFLKDPKMIQNAAALRALETMKKTGDLEFLMAAGAFVESQLPGRDTPEIREILIERDSTCFQKNKPGGSVLPSKRRVQILKILRDAAMSCFALFLIAGGLANASESRAQSAREAYDAANYDEAVALWLGAGPYETLSADTLYNIGNACYRAGHPGQAALYYRRAIGRDSSHLEARQNLRFIERKYGSIVVRRPDYQYYLAKIPLGFWKDLTWSGFWFLVVGILVFPATRQGAKVRIPAILCMVTGPLLASCALLGWHYFPNDAEFAPINRLAVVTGDKTIAHTEASRTSAEVIDAPPGSLCEIIRESGRWVYVSFASKTRGWIPAESVERILPEQTPSAPKIRKPKADGKSA